VIKRYMISHLDAILLAIFLLGPVTAMSQALSDAVEIELACSSTAGTLMLELTFRNRGGKDVGVFIGSVVSSERYLPSSASVEARDRESITTFIYSDPSLPAIAGRLEPWVVPLSNDVSLPFIWPLRHFVADGLRLSDKLEPYEVRFVIEATSPPAGVGYAGYPPVVGVQRSDWVSISDGCKAA
jgi:hypothetical protein